MHQKTPKQLVNSGLKFQALEPRIMFDGAAVFTGAEALDQIENQNTSQFQNDINQNDSVEILLKNKDTKKEIVFIDKGVDDYQSIVSSIDSSKSIYLIDTQENGFEKIQDVLSNEIDVDAIHIVGHANVGQVVLGNSVLNAETINSFKSNLESIGESLTKDGDILFYGCNLAKGEQGKLFVQQIGNITQADIAASDDITGEGGDWDLEKKYGIVETKGIQVVDYKHSLLQNGISSLDGFVENTGTNLRAGTSDGGHAAAASNHTDGNKPFVITLERENINSGTFNFYKVNSLSTGFEENNSGVQTAGPDITSNTTTVDASSTPMNSYYVYATENSGRNDVRSVTFENEILGVWFNMSNVIEYSGVDKSSGSYHTISEHGSGSQNAWSTEKLKWEWSTSVTDSSKPSGHKSDWFGVDTDSNILYVGFNNGNQHGDIIRVFTAAASNQAPVAVNDTDSVNEDATVTKTGSQNDVLNDDSDPDGDTITVTQIKHSTTSNSTVSGSTTYSNGTSVTGTYGTLTIGADGSYTYVADQSAADDLDAGDTATDVFTYTISDTVDTATATLTITVTGINDAPVAVDDTDSVAEDATVTKTGSQNDVLNDDTDADDSASLSVSQIKKSGGSNSAVSSSTTYSNGTSVTGTYGTLTIGADGSYTYTADQTAADALDVNDSVTDTFVYTLSDGTDTDTANLVITVTGVNDTPSAQNDVGVINEGETLTVTNGSNPVLSGSYDATGENSGDLMDTNSSSHQDSDPDASPTLRISAIQPSGGSSSSVSSGSSYNSSGTSVTGTYGTLTIGADGSYTYAANDSISGFDASETLTDTFTYTLSDEHDATDTATLTITLLGQDNEAPSATDNTNAVNEDETVTVTNGTSGVTGDVLINDTDPESDTLTVTKIKKSGGSDSNVSSGSSYNSSGTSVTGTYGTLTIGADGSYTYTADQDAADALDAGDTENDVFVYTVSDGNGGTDTANITITVTGTNEPPVAVNDTDSVNEDATVTKTGAQNDVLNDDTDGDASSSLTVTKIRPNGGSDSTVSSGSTYNSSGRSVTGTYGTLTIGADGSYTYTADQSAADDLDASDTVTDVFTYTISDGTETATATLTITVTGVNDTPVAVNDTDAVNEDATITKTSSQDDVLNDDTDADDSASLSVTAIQPSGGSSSNVSSGSSYNSSGTSVTGTYGTLVIGADGSYTYTADQSAADDLDASDTVTDVFTYTLSDGTATDTATLTITVTGINDAPDAIDDTDSVNEDATVTKTGSQNDVLNDDTDADDSASLTVTQIKKSGGSDSAVSSSTTYSNGTSVTGTYGTLTIGADGSYTYVADQDAADALDAGDTVTDVFVYTISDGNDTDSANLTITVTGVNDDPVAVNDTDSVNEDATVTKTSSEDDVLNDDTDADASASLTVTQIKKNGGSNSAVSSGSSYNSSGTSVTGTYGTLTIGADGSYTYVADQAAADALDAGDTVTDVFVYTASDGTATDTANLTITVTGVNDTPTAQNDVGVITEDSTLTVTNGAEANVSGSYDATGEHSGDVLDTTSSSHKDSDLDASASLVVSQIKKNGGSNSSVSSGSSYNSNGTSVTGTYGTLTIGADGSYTYAADQTAADNIAAGESQSDVFVYTMTDGTENVSANLTITVLGANDNPTAQDDVGVINEGGTLTVQNGDNANVSGSFDANGENSGDVIDTTSSSHKDTDLDTSDTLSITKIKKSGGSDSNVSSGSSYNSSGTAVTGTYGTLTIGADGSYKYVAQSDIAGLNDGATVTDTFTYTLSDGTATTTADITITVIGGASSNNSPSAVNDTDAVNEDATITKTGAQDDVLNDDSDSDGDTITVNQIQPSGGSASSVSAGSTYNSSGTSVTGTYGTLTIGADGSYTYVADQSAADDLDASDTATDTFTYRITDGTATDTATLTITVTGVNDTPSAVNDTDAVNEDATITKTSSQDDVLNDDTDADDDDTFSVTAIQPSGGSSSSVSSGSSYNSSGTSVTGTYGTLTIGADGSYTYVADQSAADALDASDTVTDVFTYTISDGDATDTATLTITVTGINDDPVAVDDTDSVNEDATVTKTGSQNDVLNDDTDADDSSSVTVTQIKKDGGSNSAVNSGSTYASSGTSVTGTYGTLTIGADGSYTYVADQSAADDLDAGDTATDVFVYTVSDGTSTDTANLTITVTGINDDPAAVNDTDSVNEDATVTKTGSQDDVLNDDTDADDSASLVVTNIQPSGGSSSTVSSSTTYSNGTSVTGTYGTLTIGADGSYTYVADQSAADALDASDTATDVFTYTLSDGTATDTATLTITVTGINDEPVAVNDTDAVNEDATITKTGSEDDVLNDDTDADDSSSLTVTQIKKDGGSNSAVNSGSTYNSSGTSITGTYGTLTIGADGSYTYVADQSAADDLDAGDTETDVFVYTVSDGTTTQTANLTITVTGVNDTPAAVDDTDTVNEDATVTKTGSQNDVLNDDTDADDSASLNVSAIQPSGGSSSTVSSSTTYSNGTSVTGTYGTLTIGADGSYTYVADQAAADALDASDTATDVFTYTLSDGTATDTATLTITVTGVNDTPVAVDDTDAVNEDATVTKTSSEDDVLNDDTDADDSSSVTVTQIKKDGGSNSAVSSGSSYNSSGTSVTGTYGTLTIGADGSYTYVADQSAADDLDAGDQVTDVFTYTVSDGSVTDTANITITVTGVNDTPSATNDTDSVNEDETVTKTGAQDDLLNDDSDPDDSASLSVTNISHSNGNTGTVASSSTYASNGTQIVGTYGTLTVGADGSYTYTADQDAADSIADGSSETDVFTYTLSDGSATDTATITITVSGADNEVAGVNDTGAVDDNSTLSVGNQSAGVLSNDTDNGSAALSVGEASVSAIRTGRENASGTDGTIGSTLVGTYGSLTLNSDGTYDYTANTDAAEALAPTETAVDYFTYTISDGTSTDTAELQITVTGINDAPTSSTPATIYATENQSVTIQTKTFFSDPDPSSNSFGQLTYSVSGLPAGLTINSNGKVTGIVTQGTYTFTVTATDGGNLSTQQTFTLEVAKSNDVDAVPEKLKINKKNIEKKVKNKTVVFKERSVVQVANLEIAKDYSFNGGMRVVDVAVEDLSNNNTDDPTPMSKSFLNEGTILGFAIGDDYKINVKQYTATMENGSAVPDWVKVDPKTGQTLVQFPDNIYSIDIKIIAIDKDNTTREIDLTLDQSSIKPDKSLKRSLENFIDRSSTLKSEVFIDNNGNMQLNALNKNQIDLNRTANLNNSEIVDIENNSNNNSTLSTLKLASIDKNLDKITVKIADDKRNQVVKYSLSIPEQGLAIGNQIPNWLKINAETGEIEATPPQGLDTIKLQIIAEDEDGTLRTLEVDLDLSSNDQSKLPSKTIIDKELEKFASLQDQIHVKYNDYENYGDKIVKVAS